MNNNNNNGDVEKFIMNGETKQKTIAKRKRQIELD